MAAENADTVAGFFGLRAIRVEDAEAEGAVGAFNRTIEDAIGAEAEVAVADFADSGDREKGGAVLRLEDEVVVAEGVVFRETHA